MVSRCHLGLFCCGILLALVIPAEADALAIGAVMVCLLACRLRAVPAALLVGWIAAGLGIASLQFAVLKSQRVTSPHTVPVSGCIVSVVVTRDNVSKFDFATELRWSLPGGPRYRVTWYNPAPAAAPGTCWRLALRLKPPRGSLNEIGLDYDRWLFSRQFAGIASVKNLPINQPVSYHWPGAALMSWRWMLHGRLTRLLEAHPSAALVSALAVGVRSALNVGHWDVLRYTGTAHLMAISGLHIGLAAMLGFVLGRYLPVRLSPEVNLVDRGRSCGLAFALAYATLAGFAISTIRAFTMVLIWYGLTRARVSTDAWTILLLALAVVLSIDPFAAAGIGLWLSAGAVAAIIAVTSTVDNVTGLAAKLRLAVRIQLLLTLMLLPLSVSVSGGISWLAAPVNLVLIPLFSFVVVPGLLVALLLWLPWRWLSEWLFECVAALLDAVWMMLEKMAAHNLAFTTLGAAPLWSLLLFVVVGLVLLLPRTWPMRNLVGVLLAPAFLLRPERPAAGETYIDVLDVGQALAVLVQTRDHLLVYDTGNAWPGNDSGRILLSPVLRNRRLSRIDDLVISHNDRDHAGGAASLLDEFETGRVWMGEHTPVDPHSRQCRRGISWRYDGVRFAFLHPAFRGEFTGNEQSCVLQIDTHGSRILITGDLGQDNERRLIETFGEVRADLVIGGHHGSLTSSDPVFIAAVMARYVVFSNGYGNQWDMPRTQVVTRWARHGAVVLQTATSGQIQFRSDAARGLRLYREAREGRTGRWRWRAD